MNFKDVPWDFDFRFKKDLLMSATIVTNCLPMTNRTPGALTLVKKCQSVSRWTKTEVKNLLTLSLYNNSERVTGGWTTRHTIWASGTLASAKESEENAINPLFKAFHKFLPLQPLKGTQAWEFFGLWFWNLYFFVVSYA